MKKIIWKDEPEEHDYPAAESYLNLLYPTEVNLKIRWLKTAPISYFKAKDILRAADLPLLPKEDVHVAKDLAKIYAGERMVPILLVHGDHQKLIIADGYHRVCAVYHFDYNQDIPCKL
jgi:hypothetical protein